MVLSNDDILSVVRSWSICATAGARWTTSITWATALRALRRRAGQEPVPPGPCTYRKAVKRRLGQAEQEPLPHDLISSSRFLRPQRVPRCLCAVLDQTNLLAEITHKRASALVWAV